jgi:signal transduction histidine kinase
MLHDISAEKSREEELQNRNVELQLAYSQLRGAQDQLLQSEKMASIGQLAAGVAHEINNPIGYVHSNIGTLKDYTRNLFSMLAAYENALGGMPVPPDARRALDEQRERFEIDYLGQDLPSLLDESAEGIERVRKIVQDLKDFSHAGQGEEWQVADLHRGLDSTLNIVWNEIKYKAEVVKDYGPLPPIECIPSQLNQVFLNILVNAGHAIRERGTIRLSTGANAETGWIEIADTGEGIPEENLQRIFDPFFTTKQVGQGTGLGLSLSYSIVKKHGGRIEVSSKPGQGTAFRILLPLRQPEPTTPPKTH